MNFNSHHFITILENNKTVLKIYRYKLAISENDDSENFVTDCDMTIETNKQETYDFSITLAKVQCTVIRWRISK